MVDLDKNLNKMIFNYISIIKYFFIFAKINKMVAGTFQLQARGIQDIYLTKDPEINVFQYQYFRYVNFANDLYKIPLNDAARFNSKTHVVIPKKGHLLSKLYLHLKLPRIVKTDGTYACWTDSIGHAIFNGPIELQIGGVIVDRLYPVCLDMLDELSTKTNKLGHDRMLLKSDIWRSAIHNSDKEANLMIPLDFWFTKHYSMALPLLSMTSQDIQINFNFADFNKVVNYDGLAGPSRVDILDSTIFAEYVMLDDIVLDQFQRQKHQYVITQMVYNGDDNIAPNESLFSTKINFNNPCKELLFCCVDQVNYDDNNYFNYSRRSDEECLIKEASLLLDGKHRYDNFLPEFIFRDYFPNIVHSVIPSKYFYIMPFALKPEDDQPTGSLNMSRFDEILLNLKLNNNNPACKLYVFGIMYNILTISDGVLTFEWVN